MRLKELRVARSLYQKDIAEHLGIDRTTYVKYENGSSEPPLDSLIDLANFYSVSLDYLVGITDTLKQPNADLNTQYTDTERELIENFRSMNRQGQDYILQSMAMAVTIYKNSDLPYVETQV